MSAEGDLEVGQAALGMRRAERAHSVDDEAVVLDRRVKALLPVPCPIVSLILSRTLIELAYRSCYSTVGSAYMLLTRCESSTHF